MTTETYGGSGGFAGKYSVPEPEPASPSREAEIAARPPQFTKHPNDHVQCAFCGSAPYEHYCKAPVDALLAQLQQAQYDAANEAIYGGQQRERAEKAEAALQQAREALKRYGGHDAGCIIGPACDECSCGYDDALQDTAR